MRALKDYLLRAKNEHWAMGHFNFSTAEQLRAIVEAVAELNSPVMVATSEGEAEFIGYDQAVALVRSYQAEGRAVWLNADHHKSFQSCKKAIDAGYDTVLIDASKMSYEENLRTTSDVVRYAAGLMVEGELGYLRGSSELQEKIAISPADYTQPAQAADFVARTGVERLAVVFGNIHGIVTEQVEQLDINHLQKIVLALRSLGEGGAAALAVALVLHGASGLKDEDIRAAIAAGIANVHINTELRVAYHDALADELQTTPNETTPYKILEPSFEATKAVVKQKLELFGSVNRL